VTPFGMTILLEVPEYRISTPLSMRKSLVELAALAEVGSKLNNKNDIRKRDINLFFIFVPFSK
jgi:hypothetical protein